MSLISLQKSVLASLIIFIHISTIYCSVTTLSSEFVWINKEAVAGFVPAQTYLGYCFENGLLDLDKDPKMAVFWYMKAAEQNDIWAQRHLAYCYAQGIGVEKNIDQTLAWYSKAAEQGCVQSKSILYLYYSYTKDKSNTEKYALSSNPESIKIIELRTEMICDLYDAYMKDKNYSNILQMLSEAGEQKFLISLDHDDFWYCDCHITSVKNKLNQQSPPTIPLYTKAANENQPWAQNFLGHYYLMEERDEKKAVEFLLKAATNGLSEAQKDLALCYFNGHGVEKDLNKAREWLMRSADQQHGLAQCLLDHFFKDENEPGKLSLYPSVDVENDKDFEDFIFCEYMDDCVHKFVITQD